jgi:hypothetical protein
MEPVAIVCRTMLSASQTALITLTVPDHFRVRHLTKPLSTAGVRWCRLCTETGRFDFATLQDRLRSGRARVHGLVTAAPAVYIWFDLLGRRGKDLP